MITHGELTAGHARALIGAADPTALAQDVVRRGLSVRKTEALARDVKQAKGSGASRAPARKDADTLALERDLTQLLGLKVRIDLKGGADSERGNLVIHYETLEQLDGVLRRLTQLPVSDAE